MISGRTQAAPETSVRFGCIDGVRGFLALFVCIHHFFIYYWGDITASTFSKNVVHNMGQAGVAVFFMITGFLFFHRILGGRAMKWPEFYVSRVFRIVPLYLFSVIAIVLFSLWGNNWEVVGGLAQWLLDMGRWLVYIGGDINGYAATNINLGVQWTLKYEWVFYLALPGLAWIVAKGGLPTGLLSVVVILLAIWPQDIVLYTGFYVLFLVGAITAQLALSGFLTGPWIFGNGVAAVAILALLAELTLFHSAYGVLQTVLLAVFFIPLALGNDFFGVLAWRSAEFLGKISFSIYLLHGVVFFLLFKVFFKSILENLDNVYAPVYLSVAVVVVVLVSWLSYKTIEEPFQMMGRQIRTQLTWKNNEAD